MRMGLMAGATPAVGSGLEDIVAFAKKAEDLGFDSVWMANIFGLDTPFVVSCSILSNCWWVAQDSNKTLIRVQ